MNNLFFYVHFFGAKKRTKEAFPHPRPSPEGRMQTEDCRNRQSSVRFGIAGHAMTFLYPLNRVLISIHVIKVAIVFILNKMLAH